jgi:hypothetical protein
MVATAYDASLNSYTPYDASLNSSKLASLHIVFLDPVTYQLQRTTK